MASVVTPRATSSRMARRASASSSGSRTEPSASTRSLTSPMSRRGISGRGFSICRS